MAYDFSYTQNRELSWLRFNERVLEESYDPQVPLFERLKFVSIFTSNLDEFCMIRVGGLCDLSSLKKEPVDNKSNQTPSEQLQEIFSRLPRLMDKREASFHELEAQLETYGIKRIDAQKLSGDDKTYVQEYYDGFVHAFMSPQIIDPRHPFPNMKNTGLYVIYNFKDKDSENILGMAEVPPSLNRIIMLPKQEELLRYILLEDLILRCAAADFGDYECTQAAIIRVTRNADINPDDEYFDDDGDYRQHMKRVLKKRLRLQAVRLEVQGEFSYKLIKFIRKHLKLASHQVLHTNCPLEMSYVFRLESEIQKLSGFSKQLLYPEFTPRLNPVFDLDRPLMDQIEKEDKLLFFPYDSMTPFLQLIHEAAHDESVLSIKITLYRIAKKSKLAEHLIAAAENGKEVTVLMELRARFDEENNIEWAERLEEAGCNVCYGTEGFKVHSKICQITRIKNNKLVRITQLGTGNYNEKTAKLYSDISLMTADERIAQDAQEFFKNLLVSKLEGNYHTLGVAPYGLKPLIMAGINREIERARQGLEALIVFKMNSLTDRDVIDKLAEASQAGVKVELIVRGITCLVPHTEGKTDHITIRSIVGRFLEHTRIYAFGAQGDIIYCSSADMMTRNTEHRVEICFPILNASIRQELINILHAQLSDTTKARIVSSNGELCKIDHDETQEFDSQAYFMKQAEERRTDENPDVIPTSFSDVVHKRTGQHTQKQSCATLNLEESSKETPDLSKEATCTQKESESHWQKAWYHFKLAIKSLIEG